MPIKENVSSIKISPTVNLSNKSISRFKCPYCNKTYKKKYTYTRHHKRGCKKKPLDGEDYPEPEEIGKEEEKGSENEEVIEVSTDEAIEERTIDELREEVLVLYRNDPASLITECDNEIIKHVNKMSKNDLKLKIAQKRLLIGAKLNGTMTNTVLLSANKIVGGIMKCQDEMNETTMQDDVLKESCDDLLSYYLLDSIPVTVRLALLYGSHIVTNTFEAKKKRDDKVVIIPPEIKKETKKETKKEVKKILQFLEEDIPDSPARYNSAQGMISDGKII